MNVKIQPVPTENYNLQKKRGSRNNSSYFNLLQLLVLAILVEDNWSYHRTNSFLNALSSLISFLDA